MKTQLITMKDAARVAGHSYGYLRIVSHKGEFIEPDLVIGQNQMFAPKRVKQWKAERERRKRRKSK